ncbi:unnamed protein product [Callosobruchus maculatus]|uniref:Coiled-coil domain-containing protein 22 homolog n=1 Tax=Callosobruchus maculatus TaxID=64391 RepID=A0A653C0U6_CALMS|nr:unnamed protein product [Callosobruchus maculatus]
MEEVDKIIIDSLKQLECEFEEDIVTLKQFNADMVVKAVSCCLEAITPDVSLPKKLPPSMIARLKTASDIAEHIKDLGFRGDMGYQTILYCNEVEIRRVFMFLIERLPREANKTVAPIEQTGYVPRLVKSIEENLRESLTQFWVPSFFLKNGIRTCGDVEMVNSLGNSRPLETVTLDIPDPDIENDDLKQYWIHTVPPVTQQCSVKQLIPSLLFKDSHIPTSSSYLSMIDCDQQNLVEKMESDIQLHKDLNEATSISKNKAEIDQIIEEVQSLNAELNVLREELKSDERQLSKVLSMKNEEHEILKNTVSKVKLKLKTHTLATVNKDENKAKLKNLIKKANEHLEDLANQWNEVQTPLLEELKTLQSTLTETEAKLQEERDKLNTVKSTHSKLLEDLKEKTAMEQNLIQKYQQMGRNNNRSAYTKRILEIIGNIRKQNNEIQKVLSDTRSIQKDINNLTGQVDRSFTLCDELIFRDAKSDETARRAYKLLASLRDECGLILKAVTELGQTERESRNLYEQIETEKSKEMSLKLERVCSDLAQIEKETHTLVNTNEI